jgi:hypothetical protein
MPDDVISILRLNPFPMAPEKKADQDQRIEEAIDMLRESPARRRAFVAGHEYGGVVPVTLASWLSPDRIVISEWSFTAKAWDPIRFENELDSRSSAAREETHV